MEHSQSPAKGLVRHANPDGGADVVQIERSPGTRQWTIKGIPPEAVEISRDAARRSGMKLNSWVARALSTAAGAQRATAGAASEQGALSSQMVELEEYIKGELARLQEKADHLEGAMNSVCALMLKLYMQQSRSSASN
jgi:hypothetical protein